MTNDFIAAPSARFSRLRRRLPAMSRLCSALGLWFGLQGALLAQTDPAATPSAQRDSSFETMMADPTNQENTFRFAQAAAASGDLRGAIAALERMLRINPGLANIELELGVLYLRAGSPELASIYLRQALSARDVPAPVRERAQALLARTERAKSRHITTGTLYGGLRYDNNANAGPDSRSVRVAGTTGLIDEEDTGQSDTSAELAASVNYVYIMDNQAGHEIEASAGTYNRYYDKSRELDLNSFAADVGPRFYFSDAAAPALSLRPYITGTYVVLDRDRYLDSVGGGLNLRRFFWGGSFVETTLEISDQTYRNTDRSPNNSDRSGTFGELLLRGSYQYSAALRLFGGIEGAMRDSRKDYEAFKEGGLRVGATLTHAAPFGITDSAWSTTLSVAGRRTKYDEADPAIDPNQRRKDTRADVNLSTTIRLSTSLTLAIAAYYTNNNSDLPNYEFDNQGASLGLAWAF